MRDLCVDLMNEHMDEQEKAASGGNRAQPQAR